MATITIKRDQIEALHTAALAAKGWYIAKDQGAYIGAGNADKGGVVYYFRGCDPNKDDAWHETASAKFGGDDFGEMMEVATLTDILADPRVATMTVSCTATAIKIKTKSAKPSATNPEEMTAAAWLAHVEKSMAKKKKITVAALRRSHFENEIQYHIDNPPSWVKITDAAPAPAPAKPAPAATTPPKAAPVAKPGKLFGKYTAAAVLRYMGANGWNADDAYKAITAHGGTTKRSSVVAGLYDGRKGINGKPAALTAEEIKSLAAAK